MSADASHRTQRRLTARDRAVLAALITMLVVTCGWLWAVSASPVEARGLMALAGGASALLLTIAAALVQHYAATARQANERARLAAARADLMEREALRIADIFRAKVIDSTIGSFVFEITGSTEKIDAFIKLMEPLGLIEVSRTGVVAIARGDKGL